MLENIYTTKMSTHKKKMKNRFTKICSTDTRTHKVMATLMSVVIIITMLCANIVMAMVGSEETEQFKIVVKHGDMALEFNNKPFIYDGTVYLPLRELFEKIGIIEHEGSYIKWDNGKIEICVVEKVKRPEYLEQGAEIDNFIYHYLIEVGKAEYTLNPGKENLYRDKWNISNSKKMSHAPILKKGITYIPFAFVDYLVNRTMQIADVNCFAWDLTYDKDSERKADYINGSISIEYTEFYEKFHRGARCLE